MSKIVKRPPHVDTDGWRWKICQALVALAKKLDSRVAPLPDGSKDDQDWVAAEDLSEVPPWERLPGAKLVFRWAEDVSTALKDVNRSDWSLVGTSIGLVHEDLREGGLVARRAAIEAGLKFISITPVRLAGSVRGLRAALEEIAPVVAFIKPGGWSGQKNPFKSEEPVEEETLDLFEKELRSFNPERPVFFVSCVKVIEDFPPQLLSVGAIDRTINLSPPDVGFLSRDFIVLLGPGTAGNTLIENPGKLGAFLRDNLIERRVRERAALILRRSAVREAKPVQFSDLVDLLLRGSTETEIEPASRVLEDVRRRVAYHEAGHAIVAILASGGKAVPDYASIVPSGGFRGVVVNSVSYSDAHSEETYTDLQYRVRVGLGGRAAEELIFSPIGVGSGAVADLQTATRMTTWLFSRAGFAPDMDQTGVSSSNLAVVTEGLSSLAELRIQRMVRRFLEREHAEVIKMLNENRAFLDAVADRLMWDPIVDQGEMAEMARRHGIDLTLHEKHRVTQNKLN